MLRFSLHGFHRPTAMTGWHGLLFDCATSRFEQFGSSCLPQCRYQKTSSHNYILGLSSPAPRFHAIYRRNRPRLRDLFSITWEIAMTSNEAVGPMDIKNLLDLLNASEEGAVPGNDRETVLPLNEP